MVNPDDIRCPKCGAMYALVGRSHNCNAPPTMPVGQIPEKRGRLVPAPLIEPSTPIVAPARKAAKKKKATKFDRLKYQREYMRKRRAKAKAKKAKRARV